MVVAESGARAGMLDGRAPRGNGGPFGAAICRRTVHASMGGCHLGPSARCMAGPYGGGPGVKRGIAMHLQPAPLVGQRGRTLGLSVVGTAIPSLTAYLIGSLLKSRSNLYQLGRSAAAHPRLCRGSRQPEQAGYAHAERHGRLLWLGRSGRWAAKGDSVVLGIRRRRVCLGRGRGAQTRVANALLVFATHGSLDGALRTVVVVCVPWPVGGA